MSACPAAAAHSDLSPTFHSYSAAGPRARAAPRRDAPLRQPAWHLQGGRVCGGGESMRPTFCLGFDGSFTQSLSFCGAAWVQMQALQVALSGPSTPPTHRVACSPAPPSFPCRAWAPRTIAPPRLNACPTPPHANRLQGLGSKNNRTKIECCEELGDIVQREGMGPLLACRAKPVAALAQVRAFCCTSTPCH